MLDSLLNKLSRLLDFCRYLVGQLVTDGCIQRAASLTFTSLFAVVPLMTVSYAVLARVPDFQGVGEQLQQFIFHHFVPSTSNTLYQYLQQFAQQASRLTGVGVLFLVITAFSLMVAIEKTFNTIWKAPPRPRGVSRFLLYWSILSLGPLLLGLAFVVSSYVTSLPFIAGAAETLGGPAKLLPYLPFILSSLAFIAIYAIIPNTHVPLGYACLGGLFSALLFELAKLIFTLFLRYFPTYELVYGAFAAAPLFLIWVYLCWLIILLGAEWVYALTNYRYRQRQDKWPDFITALAVVHYCYQQQQRGRAVTVNAISRQYYPLNQNQWQVIRRVLLRARIIVQVEQGRYLLARDLAHFSLHEFMRLFPWRWPSRFNQQDLPWLVTIGHVVTAINEAAKDHTSISLAELFTNKAIADANPNN